MRKKIVLAPKNILDKPTKPIKKIDKRIKKIIKDMIETLEKQSNPSGVGLAANQIGLNLSIFITKPTEQSSVNVFINPKILKIQKNKTKKKQDKALEGCLSLPKIWALIKRADKVYLKYQNKNGEMKKKWFNGFEAVIIQHEVDHLQGILFTQRALEQKQNLYEEKKGQLEKLSY